MTLDFHYYITYIAAREAGFSGAMAHRIAIMAQAIDEACGSGLKTPTTNAAPVTRTAHKMGIKNPKETSGFMSKKKGRSEDYATVWVAFHFLPGNYGDSMAYGFNYRGHVNNLDTKAKSIGKTKSFLQFGSKGRAKKKAKSHSDFLDKHSGDMDSTKWGQKSNMICAPYSTQAQGMMDDIIELSKLSESALMNRVAAKAPKLNALNQKIGTKLNKLEFLISLTGARVHVLADTFAHQGCAGFRSKATNDHTDFQTFEGGKWKTHKIRGAKGTPAWLSLFGHGRFGHYPDVPSAVYKWTRPWDGQTFNRNNPTQFMEAFMMLVQCMQDIRKALKLNAVDSSWDRQMDKSFFSSTAMKKDVKPRLKYLRDYIIKRDGRDLELISEGDAIKMLDHDWLTHFSVACEYHQNWVIDFCEKNILKMKFDSFLSQVRSSASDG